MATPSFQIDQVKNLGVILDSSLLPASPQLICKEVLLVLPSFFIQPLATSHYFLKCFVRSFPRSFIWAHWLPGHSSDTPSILSAQDLWHCWSSIKNCLSPEYPHRYLQVLDSESSSQWDSAWLAYLKLPPLPSLQHSPPLVSTFLHNPYHLLRYVLLIGLLSVSLTRKSVPWRHEILLVSFT